jgi:hypothetical protein
MVLQQLPQSKAFLTIRKGLFRKPLTDLIKNVFDQNTRFLSALQELRLGPQ